MTHSQADAGIDSGQVLVESYAVNGGQPKEPKGDKPKGDSLNCAIIFLVNDAVQEPVGVKLCGRQGR
jgi:hypothetical protein